MFSTLSHIGALPGGSEMVFDYGDPPDTFDPELLAAHNIRADALPERGGHVLLVSTR